MFQSIAAFWLDINDILYLTTYQGPEQFPAQLVPGMRTRVIEEHERSVFVQMFWPTQTNNLIMIHLRYYIAVSQYFRVLVQLTSPAIGNRCEASGVDIDNSKLVAESGRQLLCLLLNLISLTAKKCREREEFLAGVILDEPGLIQDYRQWRKEIAESTPWRQSPRYDYLLTGLPPEQFPVR